MRHGPHQGAQKSTSTGTEEVISWSKDAAVASTIHGSSVWHTLQRGTPELVAATLFFVPHCEHLTIVLWLTTTL